MLFGIIFLLVFLILFLFVVLIFVFLMLEILVVVFLKGDVNKRKWFVWLGGIVIFIVGVLFVLFYGVLSDVFLFYLFIFDVVDYFVSNILMLLGVLLIFIFVLLKILK